MHDHLPEGLGQLAQALFHSVSSAALDDLGDRAQLGVKRFAKALTRVKPDIKHSEAIEVIAKALKFKNWHDLTASLSKIDRSIESMLTRIEPVLDVPVASYDRPCPSAAAQLELFALRIGEMLGVSKQEVLDQVVAFVHEAPSFEALMAREPCFAGPCFEVVYDDPERDDSYVRITPQGRAAAHALAHELDRLSDDRDEMVDLLISIVNTNRLCFRAWTMLLLQIGDTQPGSSFALAWSNECFGVLMEFLDTVDSLDADDQDLRDIFLASRLLAQRLIECGECMSAYSLAREILNSSEGEDPENIRYFMAAALTHESVVDEIYEEVESHELLEDFAEGVREHDPDSMLCVGMLMLMHGDIPYPMAMSFLARSNLATLGAMRLGLDGSPEELWDVDGDLLDAPEFSCELVRAFFSSNPDLCMNVARLMNTPAMRKAERDVAELYDNYGIFDSDSLDEVDGDIMFRSEIVSRARALSKKMADTWAETH